MNESNEVTKKATLIYSTAILTLWKALGKNMSMIANIYEKNQAIKEEQELKEIEKVSENIEENIEETEICNVMDKYINSVENIDNENLQKQYKKFKELNEAIPKLVANLKNKNNELKSKLENDLIPNINNKIKALNYNPDIVIEKINNFLTESDQINELKKKINDIENEIKNPILTSEANKKLQEINSLESEKKTQQEYILSIKSSYNTSNTQERKDIREQIGKLDTDITNKKGELERIKSQTIEKLQKKKEDIETKLINEKDKLDDNKIEFNKFIEKLRPNSSQDLDPKDLEKINEILVSSNSLYIEIDKLNNNKKLFNYFNKIIKNLEEFKEDNIVNIEKYNIDSLDNTYRYLDNTQLLQSDRNKQENEKENIEELIEELTNSNFENTDALNKYFNIREKKSVNGTKSDNTAKIIKIYIDVINDLNKSYINDTLCSEIKKKLNINNEDLKTPETEKDIMPKITSPLDNIKENLQLDLKIRNKLVELIDNTKNEKKNQEDKKEEDKEKELQKKINNYELYKNRAENILRRYDNNYNYVTFNIQTTVINNFNYHFNYSKSLNNRLYSELLIDSTIKNKFLETNGIDSIIQEINNKRQEIFELSHKIFKNVLYYNCKENETHATAEKLRQNNTSYKQYEENVDKIVDIIRSINAKVLRFLDDTPLDNINFIQIQLHYLQKYIDTFIYSDQKQIVSSINFQSSERFEDKLDFMDDNYNIVGKKYVKYFYDLQNDFSSMLDKSNNADVTKLMRILSGLKKNLPRSQLGLNLAQKDFKNYQLKYIEDQNNIIDYIKQITGNAFKDEEEEEDIDNFFNRLNSINAEYNLEDEVRKIINQYLVKDSDTSISIDAQLKKLISTYLNSYELYKKAQFRLFEAELNDSGNEEEFQEMMEILKLSGDVTQQLSKIMTESKSFYSPVGASILYSLKNYFDKNNFPELVKIKKEVDLTTQLILNSDDSNNKSLYFKLYELKVKLLFLLPKKDKNQNELNRNIKTYLNEKK